MTSQTRSVGVGLLYFLKPSDDVPQVGDITLDNFKYFCNVSCRSVPFNRITIDMSLHERDARIQL